MAAGVDAAHELLAEEAALRERHRVAARGTPPAGSSCRRCRAGCTGIACSMRHASYASPAIDERVDARGERVDRAGRRGRSPTRSSMRSDAVGHSGDAGSRRSLGPMRDSMPQLAGAVDDLGLHPDPEPVERRWRAAHRGRGRSRATPRRPTRSRRKSTSSLPCGVEQQRVHRVAVGERVEVGRHQRLQERERVGAGDEHEPAVGAVDDQARRRAALRARRLRHAASCGLPAIAERREARAAAAAAVSNARALLRHSRSSSAGTESATMPGARLHARLAVAPDHRADRDRGVEVAGEVDVADHAGVRRRASSARARR